MRLVRHGGDAVLYKSLDPETEKMVGGHKLVAVYGEMLRQIAIDYSGLPDLRSLSMSEIRFFYEGLRHSLQQRTRPRPKQKK